MISWRESGLSEGIIDPAAFSRFCVLVVRDRAACDVEPIPGEAVGMPDLPLTDTGVDGCSSFLSRFAGVAGSSALSSFVATLRLFARGVPVSDLSISVFECVLFNDFPSGLKRWGSALKEDG